MRLQDVWTTPTQQRSSILKPSHKCNIISVYVSMIYRNICVVSLPFLPKLLLWPFRPVWTCLLPVYAAPEIVLPKEKDRKKWRTEVSHEHMNFSHKSHMLGSGGSQVDQLTLNTLELRARHRSHLFAFAYQEPGQVPYSWRLMAFHGEKALQKDKKPLFFTCSENN